MIAVRARVFAGTADDGSSIYQLFLGAYETRCGADVGYMKVPEFEAFDRSVTSVPLRLIAGPESL